MWTPTAMERLSSKEKIKSFSQRLKENMLHCHQMFVRLSYGDILNKKEEACHYQVTERTIQRDLETIRSVLEEERKKGRDDRMLLYDRGQNGYKICRVYENQKEDTEERSM